MWTTGETWTVEFIKTQFLEYSCFGRYALHKCCTSYPILKKSKISSITKDFILYLLAPRIRMCYNSHSSYRRVLPWSLGTMQKHEELTSTGYTDKWCCTHIHDPAIFFYFFGVFGCFFVDLMTSSVGTYGNGSKTSSTENLHPSVLFDKKMRSIGHQMRS